MAVLNRDEFISRVNDFIGENSSDDAISFLDDMIDTYEDLANKSTTDWEQRYHDLDEAWKKRYKRRFLTAASVVTNEDDDDETTTLDVEEINIDDLFD